MKHKITAVLLCTAVMIANISIPMHASAGTENTGYISEPKIEDIVSGVKSRFDISAEFSEFKMDYFNSENGEMTYSLSWEMPEESEKYGRISVACDGEGIIYNYDMYVSDMYDNKQNKVPPTDRRDNVVNTVTENLKKMFPEFFSEGDEYRVESSNFNLNGKGSVVYARYKDGVYVWDNTITVRFCRYNDEYVITNITITHDYDAKFGENTEGENIKERYSKMVNNELMYNAVYDYSDGKKITPVLRYVTSDAPFMDPVTGEEIEMDPIKSRFKNVVADSNSLYEADKGEESDRNGYLTDEEIAEIEKVSNLMSADECVQILKSIPEFGLDREMTLKTSNMYKADNKYYVTISLANDKKGDEYKYASAVLNAQTGKIRSFCRNKYEVYHSDEETRVCLTQDELDNIDELSDFLEKYGDGFEGYKLYKKTGYCTDDETFCNQSFKKYINNIPYSDSYANITFDTNKNIIDEMSIYEVVPTEEFINPDTAVSKETAFDTLLEVYPLRPVFVKSDGIYKKAYVIAERTAYVDAIRNKVVGYNNTEITADDTYSYDDISGHWAEDAVAYFAQFNIGFDGGRMNPDTRVTFGEFKEITDKVITSSKYFIDNDEGIFKDTDEASHITRESAVYYIVYFMGLEKAANIQGIYKTGFVDEGEISPEYIGACAIAKGLGIADGDGGMFMPKEYITRAQAIMMLYRYAINK